jgi:hypothetical protein
VGQADDHAGPMGAGSRTRNLGNHALSDREYISDLWQQKVSDIGRQGEESIYRASRPWDGSNGNIDDGSRLERVPSSEPALSQYIHLHR